jgi:hypothetical protein
LSVDVIQRLYPKLNKRDFLHYLEDPDFLKTTTQICVPCYLNFTSNIEPKNLVADWEATKNKSGFQFGKLTKPVEFNFSTRDDHVTSKASQITDSVLNNKSTKEGMLI